jgi:hypothetical protein
MTIDSHDLLRKADRDLKIMSYKINSIVSVGDFQREIVDGIPCEVDALEGTLIYLKLKVRGAPTPAKFSFEYKLKGDLKVYVSKIHKTPDAINNQKVFNNVMNGFLN